MEFSIHFKMQGPCSAGRSLEEELWKQMSGGFVQRGRAVCEAGSSALTAQHWAEGSGAQRGSDQTVHTRLLLLLLRDKTNLC